ILLASLSGILSPGSWFLPLPLHPNGAILEVLLLPDGDYLLQAVNRVLTRFESRLAMRRSHHYYNTRFAYLDSAQSMNHADAADRPALMHFADYLVHRLERHFVVA